MGDGQELDEVIVTATKGEDTSNSEGIDKINDGLGAFGLANGAKNELIKSSGKGGGLGPGTMKYLKYSKGLGYVGAGLTTTYSVTNAYNYFNNGGTDWQVYTKSGLDVIMTGVGFLGPIGFGVSASYFILDASTKGFKGFGQIKP